ncbi:MAG: hypothetical protein HYV02_08715 [Deltaproteobacteria bacterium]|nr:hypothetical protein [Deltaproteobacteria bacterium]
MVELGRLQFFVPTSPNLKQDDVTTLEGCATTEIVDQRAGLPELPKAGTSAPAAPPATGDLKHVGTVTCNFPQTAKTSGETVPAEAITFQLYGETTYTSVFGERFRHDLLHVHSPLGRSATLQDPELAPAILMNRNPNHKNPFQDEIKSFPNEEMLRETVQGEKDRLRTEEVTRGRTNGPILTLGGGPSFQKLSETSLPPSTDAYGTQSRSAAAPYEGVAGVFQIIPHYPNFGFGALANMLFEVGVDLRGGTLSANDRESGIPGEEADLDWFGVRAMWRPNLSCQRLAQLISWGEGASDESFDVQLTFPLSIVDYDRFEGDLSYGGRSVPEHLDRSRTTWLGEETPPFTWELSGRGCWTASESMPALFAPCIGGWFRMTLPRGFSSDGFYGNIGPEFLAGLDLSALNYTRTERREETTPSRVDLLPPPPMARQVIPLNPPTLHPVVPPKRDAEGLEGITVLFANARHELTTGDRANIDSQVLEPLKRAFAADAQIVGPDRPYYYLNVAGHASTPGAFNKNMSLSYRRTDRIPAYMLQQIAKARSGWEKGEKVGLPPYPPADHIQFRTFGFGETSPVTGADGKEDVTASRRAVVSIHRDEQAAATEYADVPITEEARKKDEGSAASLVSLLSQAGFKATAKGGRVYVTMPTAWEGINPAGTTPGDIARLKTAVEGKTAKAEWEKMSPNSGLRIGIETSAGTNDADLNIARESEFQLKLVNFSTWPVKGRTRVTVVPAGKDGTAFMQKLDETVEAPASIPAAVEALETTKMPITIGKEKGNLYTFPIKTIEGKYLRQESYDLIQGLAEKITASQRIYAVLYTDPKEKITEPMREKLIGDVGVAFEGQAKKQSGSTPHDQLFWADEREGFATRVYFVVMDQAVSIEALTQSLYRVAHKVEAAATPSPRTGE